LTSQNDAISVLEYLNFKGLHPTGDLIIQPDINRLVKDALNQHEGVLSAAGALVVNTGRHTGRAPYDKYIVSDKDRSSIWWSKTTKSMSSSQYAQIRGRLSRHLEKRRIYFQELSICQAPEFRIKLNLATETAWHGLFAQHLFLDSFPTANDEYFIMHAPSCNAHPETDGTSSQVFIVLNLDLKEIIIGGTAYAGELKKAVFTLLNYILPSNKVLPMHCSATVGKEGDVSLFFGLSGTGKTTLSSDPHRQLIGDDEHGWSENGVFNFEGGCYAKTIRLSKEYEPIIWNAVEHPNAILENVILDTKTGLINYDDNRLTENTRGAYPLSSLSNVYPNPVAGHPNHIFFLSADAYGVLPPIAKLDIDQMKYYFLAGFTSKLGGTETGLKQAPQPTFSACFAAPFLPRPPIVYSEMLAERVINHQTTCWLVNTGWFGGSFGKGKRFPLPITRRIINAAINHELDSIPTSIDPYFGLRIPQACPDVPDNYIHPWKSWENLHDYQDQVNILLSAFKENDKTLQYLQARGLS